MEIRNLRYFLAVAREENMSRAAELLHVTQPTLSKSLKSLEEELGKNYSHATAFPLSSLMKECSFAAVPRIWSLWQIKSSRSLSP